MDVIFNPQKICEYHQEVTDTFKKYFLRLGYIEESPISIISQDDHSVRFTGSTSNTFKPYLEHKKMIPAEGIFLLQKSLRTQNAHAFLNDEAFPEWSSYFTEIGAMVRPEDLKDLFEVSVGYLLKLGVKKERINIKINSKDTDLMGCVKNSKLNLEIDRHDINYYRHEYGLPGILGRNFNLAISNKKGEFKDIGTIVIIEKNRKKIVAEMGFGVSTLIARIYSLTNSIEASTISKIIPFKRGFTSKLEDALSTAIVMIKSGVKPASRDKGRILRECLSAIDYLRIKCGYSIEDIMEFTNKYEEEEFGIISNIADIIELYLKESDLD